MSLYLEIQLCSETCFAGSGGGRIGGVDTDLETDPVSGLPIVRGRTLKGLLVEELALILRMLETDIHGPWHETATRLFGAPGRSGSAKLSFHDAQLPADLRAAVHQSPCNMEEVVAALTTVRYQTKMDNKSGAPEPHSLRSTRLLCAGLSFRAPLHARAPLSSAEKALLAACTQAVRRAGLHRNHGWGEVKLRLIDNTAGDVTADWLAGIMQSPETMSESDMAENAVTSQKESVMPHRKVLGYRLTLTTPVVLATTSSDTSAVETRPFISGAAMLGAMAWRWIAGQSDKDWAADPDFRRYFLDASVKWLNAYPEGVSGNRLLPCPLSLVQRKEDAGSVPLDVFDRASLDFPDDRQKEPDVQQKERDTQWESVGNELPFVRLEIAEDEDPKLWGRQPGRTARLHHRRDDREAGRSTDGAMFSYISLDAGERFLGHVLCESEEQARMIRELLSTGPVPLGRSRTATYGGWAEVELLPDSSGDEWHEFTRREEFSEEEEEQGRLVVTLLSDYLGVNKTGLPDPRAIENDLRDALGIDQPSVLRFLGMRPVAGYVSHWKMPRPTHPALSAGSVLVYQGVQIDESQLDKLCWEGLGVRRAEGFGRIAVQWHGVTKLGAHKETPDSNGSPVETKTVSEELVFLHRRLLMNALRRILAYRAVSDAEQVRSARSAPSAAFLGRLRARIRSATKPEDVIDFIAKASLRPEDKGLKKAGQFLARVRVGQQTLSDWLSARIQGTGDHPAPGWTECMEVSDECERLHIELDVLTEEERWILLQTHLDAFCERLRRYAVTARTRG